MMHANQVVLQKITMQAPALTGSGQVRAPREIVDVILIHIQLGAEISSSLLVRLQQPYTRMH